MVIISRDNDLYIVKLFRFDIDIFDIDSISELFKDIIFKIKKKYGASGLFDVNIYINDKYGMIIEINNIDYYLDEVDIRLHFFIDSIFMYEIDDISNYSDVYYYNNKFYTIYNGITDNEVIYKDCDKIIEEGIKIK